MITDIINIFKSECNYNKINKIGIKKLRNKENGIKLIDAIYYRFCYTDKSSTKESVTSNINMNNETNFTRQGYDEKENNIPLKTYINIFHKLNTYYNKTFNLDNIIVIGIDGNPFKRNNKNNQILNMGYYDITNGIPIDLKAHGKKNKNKEVKLSIEYIKKHSDIFKDTIIVADRAYFTYDLMDYLCNNNFKFVIRAKGEALNLDPNNIVKKGISKYNKIINIRSKVNVIKFKDINKKIIYTSKSKKKAIKHVIEIENDCNLITNLDIKNYTNQEILDIYKSRWDIEVFYKYIKYNYKFQHMKKNDKNNNNKMYLCELILTYIVKLIEKYYINKYKNDKNDVKINKSNLTKGVFDYLLYDILNDNIDDIKLNHFCKSYIKIIYNKKNRFLLKG